jgi:glutathione S-transferase
MRREVPAVQAEYVDVERARAMPGLRLVLTTGVPGPWGEAAKGVFHAKGIAFTRVAQAAGADNDDLFAWTGHRNAPIAMYEDERARTGWAEILWLAERLRPEPALVPADPEDRVCCFGIAQELLGENGFGWCRRLMLLRPGMGDSDTPPEPMRASKEADSESRPTRSEPKASEGGPPHGLARMARQYGYRRAAADAAPARVVEILTLLSRQLAAQRVAGRSYLVGDRVSAADIYWAAMAGIVAPLPADVCPMPEMMRGMYGNPGPEVAAALDPALLDHRDRIYRDYMEFPLVL